MIGWIIAIGIFVWTGFGLYALDFLPKPTMGWFRKGENQVTLIITGLGGILLLIGCYGLDSKNAIVQDLAPESVGTGATILVIDYLYRKREAQLEKRQIIQQMRSRSHDFALDAARIALDEGWLTDGSLIGANLTGAYLGEAVLYKAVLETVSLNEAHLERANLFAARLERADLWRSHLEGAELGTAHLEEAILQEAHLEGANLWRAHLEGANLFGAHLDRANLVGAHLEGASLGEAYLERARLDSAHLYGAILNRAHLEGAICNNNTEWPDDFDPKQHGVINWDELGKKEREGIRPEGKGG